jgi:hypothetical protein
LPDQFMKGRENKRTIEKQDAFKNGMPVQKDANGNPVLDANGNPLPDTNAISTVCSGIIPTQSIGSYGGPSAPSGTAKLRWRAAMAGRAAGFELQSALALEVE